MRRSRSFWMGTVTLLLAFGPGTVFAGRPLDTEDTGTVEPGKAELELSGDFAKNPEDRFWFAKSVLSFGLLPKLEGRLESGLLFFEPEGEKGRGGIGDSLLGFKYRLLDEVETLPAVLGSLTVRLPTGDGGRQLGSADVDVGLLAVASKAFGPVTLTWNGGYTFVTRDRDLDFWTLAASVEYCATKAWSLVGEIVSGLGSGSAADTAVLRAGTTYSITDRIRADAAIGSGVTRESPDLLITIGVTVRLF